MLAQEAKGHYVDHFTNATPPSSTGYDYNSSGNEIFFSAGGSSSPTTFSDAVAETAQETANTAAKAAWVASANTARTTFNTDFTTGLTGMQDNLVAAGGQRQTDLANASLDYLATTVQSDVAYGTAIADAQLTYSNALTSVGNDFQSAALAADVAGWTSLSASTGLVWADFKQDQASAKLTAWTATKSTAQQAWNDVATAEHAHQILAVTEYQTAMNSVIAADRVLASELQTAGNTRQSAISSATNTDVSTGSTSLAQTVFDSDVAYTAAVGTANIANETTNANSLRDYKLVVNASADLLEPLAQAASQTITALEQSHYTSAVTDSSFAGQSPFHQQEAEIAAATQTQQQATHTAEEINLAETTTAQTAYQTTTANQSATMSNQQAATTASQQNSEAQGGSVDGEVVAAGPLSTTIGVSAAGDANTFASISTDPNSQQDGAAVAQALGEFMLSIPSLLDQAASYINIFDEDNLSAGHNPFASEGGVGDQSSSYDGSAVPEYGEGTGNSATPELAIGYVIVPIGE